MNELTILNTTIRQDAEGRYCLNDCHKASGGEAAKKPANFMRLDTTKSLIQEIAENSHCSDLSSDGKPPFSTINGGINAGTYVCKELVYAYAMWISPSFNLAVIRAFDALVQGQVTHATSPDATNVLKTFQAGLKMARASGLTPKKAALAANAYCTEKTGENPLQIMGLLGNAAPGNVREDNWFPLIRDYLVVQPTNARLSITTIMFNAIYKYGAEDVDYSRSAVMRAAKMMRVLGWENTRRNCNGKKIRLWQVNPELVQ